MEDEADVVVVAVATQSVTAVDPAGDEVPASQAIALVPSGEYVPGGANSQDGPEGTNPGTLFKIAEQRRVELSALACPRERGEGGLHLPVHGSFTRNGIAG